MKRSHFLTAAIVALAPFAASAQPTQWGGNGHYYEFINVSVDWNQAFAAANGSSYLGMQGYLATVTSAGENAFIAGLNPNLGWLGGSDAGAAINDWTWRNGPENGQAFTYTNWNGGEPNNCCGGEDYLHINWGFSGGWNDHGGPGNPGQLNGYVVEYSGRINTVPEPSSYALMVAGLVGVGFSARRRRQLKR